MGGRGRRKDTHQWGGRGRGGIRAAATKKQQAARSERTQSHESPCLPLLPPRHSCALFYLECAVSLFLSLSLSLSSALTSLGPLLTAGAELRHASRVRQPNKWVDGGDGLWRSAGGVRLTLRAARPTAPAGATQERRPAQTTAHTTREPRTTLWTRLVSHMHRSTQSAASTEGKHLQHADSPSEVIFFCADFSRSTTPSARTHQHQGTAAARRPSAA